MELGYYLVDGEYGWDQEKFTDLIMKKGGCGAVTACDSCIYFSRYHGKKELGSLTVRKGRNRWEC